MAKRSKTSKWRAILEHCALEKRERKYFQEDMTQALVLDTTPTTVKLIGQVQEGTGPTQRIGNLINWHSMIFRLAFKYWAPVNTYPIVRVAIVYDRQPTASKPAYKDIFQDTNPTGGAGSTYAHCFTNMNNQHRFIIIRDYLYQLSPTSGAGVLNMVYAPSTGKNNIIEDYIDLQGLHTAFNGTGSPVPMSAYASGAFYLVFQSNQALGIHAYDALVNYQMRFDDAL